VQTIFCLNIFIVDFIYLRYIYFSIRVNVVFTSDTPSFDKDLVLTCPAVLNLIKLSITSLLISFFTTYCSFIISDFEVD